MTSEEAIEIRIHLIDELIKNGFEYIVNQIDTHLLERVSNENVFKDSSNSQNNNIDTNPHSLLNFYIAESIDVLEKISNDNFDEIITKLNSSITDDNTIKTISVLSIDGETEDLRELPSYKEIIQVFREIQNEISQEG